MKNSIYGVVILIVFSSCSSKAPTEKLIIDLTETGAPVASSMYGIFFEEINNAGDGGLYAELVMNRSFEELEMPEGYRAEGDRLIPKPVMNHLTHRVDRQTYDWTTDPVPGWSLNVGSGAAEMKLTKERPHFATAPNNLRVTIANADRPIQLVNSGYWGMSIVEGETYRLRTIIRPSMDYGGTVTVKLISENGTPLASSELDELRPNQWNDVRKDLVASANDSRAKLSIEFDATGSVWLDYVSLFPENTFLNRPDGLRRDVAQFLADMKPAFVRYPGGCVVEGISLANRFEWKKTLGDPATRSGEYSLWGYRNTYGFGYHEFLQFAEDIDAAGMFVCNVGLGCQYRMGDACPPSEINFYLQDCLDAIEYAIGDDSSEWGTKRAASGHPDPFPLKYVEIGNENWGPEYDRRFDIFYAAIKKKYPELILISNHGLNGAGNIQQTDMIDPHWYAASDFFFSSTALFDDYERGNYSVYVGEYACNSGVGSGNIMAALSEAAFITGMERNGDLVTMTSYAPLLENRNNRSWPVNLIWLDTDQVVGRSSYYVQKMNAENMPTYNLAMNKTMSSTDIGTIPVGSVGVGTWETRAEFKDFKITKNGTITGLDPGMPAMQRGEWQVTNGVLKQTSMSQGTRYILDGFTATDYTLEFMARKIEGNEGFFVHFASYNNHQDGFAFNLGGWDNTRTTVQSVVDAMTSSQRGSSVPQVIETGKWYNVKITVYNEVAELFLDDELILTYVNESISNQFFAAGYDQYSGEVIIKVVNADSNPYRTGVQFDGASDVTSIGTAITLSARSGDDENSFENPRKIYPHVSEFKGLGEYFTYEFPPFSYTILRVKVAVKPN